MRTGAFGGPDRLPSKARISRPVAPTTRPIASASVGDACESNDVRFIHRSLSQTDTFVVQVGQSSPSVILALHGGVRIPVVPSPKLRLLIVHCGVERLV